jgi:hypothetical protein
VSIEQVEDALTELMQEREQAVVDTNKERLQQVQSQVAARESDPESVSVGAEKTPKEAAEALVNPQSKDSPSTVPDDVLTQGPENAAVQNQAQKCVMDPKEFFEFALDELDDDLLEVEFGTRYDRSKSTVEHAVDSGIATDGGGRR